MKKMKKTFKENIIISTSFPAVHCWPACDIEEVSFLKNPHRHIFRVTLKVPVNHGDREIEFLHLKEQVNEFIRRHLAGKDLGNMSCENLCDVFAHETEAVYCSVMEDGENGAEAYYEYK